MNKGFFAVPAVLAVSFVSLLLFNHMPEQQYKSKLHSGEKYVDAFDYEKAALAYMDAIAIMPKKDRAYMELSDTYLLQAKSADESDTKAIKEAYQSAADTLVDLTKAVKPEEASFNYTAVYVSLGDVYMDQGDYLEDSDSDAAEKAYENADEAYQNAAELIKDDQTESDIAAYIRKQQEKIGNLQNTNAEDAKSDSADTDAAENKDNPQTREEQDLAAYKSILDQLYADVTGSADSIELSEDTTYIYELKQHGTGTENDLGFSFMDMDGDGTDELLIVPLGQDADSSQVILMYGMAADGTPKRIFSSENRNTYYLCENNVIMNFGDSGVFISTHYFEKYDPSGQLQIIEGLGYNASDHPENPWYTTNTYDYDPEKDTLITEDQYNSILAKYVKVTPDKRTPFSQYPGADTLNTTDQRALLAAAAYYSKTEGTGITLSASDSELFWKVIEFYFSTAHEDEMMSDGHIIATADQIEKVARAVFQDFTTIPEVPDDLSTYQVILQADGTYSLGVGDAGAWSFEFQSKQQEADGTVTAIYTETTPSSSPAPVIYDTFHLVPEDEDPAVGEHLYYKVKSLDTVSQ